MSLRRQVLQGISHVRIDKHGSASLPIPLIARSKLYKKLMSYSYFIIIKGYCTEEVLFVADVVYFLIVVEERGQGTVNPWLQLSCHL